ncbi:1974_t:CDS:2, partial [Racocetra fulgida]
MDAQYHQCKCQALISEEAILEKMTNTEQHQLLRQQKKLQPSLTHTEALLYSKILPVELNIETMNIVSFASILANCETLTGQGPHIYHISEILNEEDQRAQFERRQPLNVEIIFDYNQQSTQKQYNSPQTNEVAAIVISSNSNQFSLHHLVMHPRASNSDLQIIPVINTN